MARRYPGGFITATFKPLDPHGANYKLWTWGQNADGILGQNNVISKSSPVQVGALTTWAQISSGAYNHHLAIKTDGTLWAWGKAAEGQLGDNNSVILYRSSPVQIGTDTTWSKIDVGQYHTLAVKTNGTLWSWGAQGSYGQLGNESLAARSSPVQVGALTNWAQVFTQHRHSTAIKTDGSLWVWGDGQQGKLGDNTVISKSSPIQIGSTPATATTNWSVASLGTETQAAIRTDGTLWLWGLGTSGEIGNGAAVSKSSPTQVGSLTTWSKISTGPYATSAIKTDGTIWSWGNDASGSLGQNTLSVNKSSPVQIGALTTWSQSECGTEYTLAIKTDGTLWSWGKGIQGQLGINLGGIGTSRSSPVQIGATPLAETNNWSLAANGNYHTIAIKTDGTMWSWGKNEYGQIGDNAVINRSSPVQVGALTTWSKIDGGDLYSMALKTDGTMWTWGYNANGELGQNNVINRSSPVQLGAEITWSKIAANSGFSMAIKTDSTMWSWGNNEFGQIGDNTVIKRSSPVQVGALTTWSQIAGGRYHSIAIKTDGTMWTWGYNNFGQLGSNTTYNNKSSPVQVGGLTTWSKIASSAYNSLAIKTDGTIWTWGYNINGQLGDNTILYRSSPVQVGALTTWLQAVVGYANTVAIKTDGTMWTWGRNELGQIGDNTVIYRSSPVQLGALTTWSVISANKHTNSAIETDGTWYSWGYNQSGQIGDNTVISRSSPTQIGAAIYGWSQVSAKSESGAAVRADGSLWTFGYNTYGNIGDNTIIKRSSPVQVGVSTDWSLVSLGINSVAAIKTNGTLWAWGQGTAGQVGNNANLNRSSPVQIGALTTWSQVDGGAYHFVAKKTDGTLWSFGYNVSGNIGDGTNVYRSSPVQIGSLSTWSQVSGGNNRTAAIKADGTMWVWGGSGGGSLGLGGVDSRSSPVQLGAEIYGWSRVSVGVTYTVATKTDGTLWAFGYNGQGHLGNNSLITRSSPTQVGALTDWSQASTWSDHVAATKTDGTMWAWGANSSGQLGQNTSTINRSSPIQIGALTTWSKISAGSNQYMATKTDGTMWAWGTGTNGALGDNTVITRSSPVQVGISNYWSNVAAGLNATIAIESVPF